MELIMLVVLIVLYMLPSIIANSREHIQTGPITVLNLLLGWTLLVWVICLAWSFSGKGE